MATECEIAWAAGFFEGEGYFSPNVRQLKDGPRVYPTVGLKNTDREMLERFHRIVGVGFIRPDAVGEQKRSAHHKDSWRWRATSRTEAEYVLHLLKPWLSPRRLARAAEIFDDRGDLKSTERCPSGHPYTADNIYLWRGRPSYRACRTCVLGRQRLARERRRTSKLSTESL